MSTDRIAIAQRQLDAGRYAWATWLSDDKTQQIIGLLDHVEDEHRPMMVAESHRDAKILLNVMRALEVTTPDGLPFNQPLSGPKTSSPQRDSRPQ